MESNPDYDKKRDAAPALTAEDVANAVAGGLALVSQVQTVSSLLS